MYRYIKSSQPIFAGTKYDKKAAQILVDSGMYNDAQANEIIDALFHQDIHAFSHAPNWAEKYLVGIARMCVEESGKNPSRVADFLNDSVDVFDSFINYVKANRDKLGGADFDSIFMRTMKYQDVVDMLDEIQSQYDEESRDALSKMSFKDSSNYKLVPIDSYEQMHELFGGHWTGDGSSDRYAGGGGTAWCHANSESVYRSWIERGRFFVLADKNFKKIPFNAESNRKYEGKDRYGNSLLALLVGKSGKLKACTLRCNHVGVDSDADHQYKTYAELSKIAGFNVEEAISEYYDEFTEDGSYLIIENNEFRGIDEDEIDIEGITDVVIPNGVTSIGEYALCGYRYLTSVTIPDSVILIEERAFEACRSLTNITIPNSVTRIREGAFRFSGLTSVTIPDSVTGISDRTFYGCARLTSVNIPSSVTIIGWKAFCGCSSLTNITIPDSVTNIGTSAFSDCTNLTTIKISDSMTSIGDSVFSGCERLKSITIPDSVLVIGKSAFKYCSNLTNIEIPDSVISIGELAFYACPNLTNITIPDSVRSIGEYAFYKCDNLMRVTIPDSLTKIGEDAFPETCEIIRR